MKCLLIIAVILVCRCHSRAVSEDDSVVSVYTTLPTTFGTNKPLDVYHQIANNIAERITSPIFRLFGVRANKTEDEKTAKKSWQKIELLDENAEEVTKAMKPVDDNDISENRDVEELSAEVLRKSDKKPEKIILYSSYLPVTTNYDVNNTVNDINNTVNEIELGDDEPFEFDDKEKCREGGFVYFLELIGSFIQLAYGAISAIFKSSSSESS